MIRNENDKNLNPVVLDISDREDIFKIERKEFLGCKTLRKVILSSSVKVVGDWAFSKCTNLRSFAVAGKYNGNIFGRGVFKGDDNLKKILFEDFDEDTSYLIAACANRMYNEHLITSDDVGSEAWYKKWDISLLSLLSSRNEDGMIGNMVCGEEDISYSNVGMVDGEMPAEGHEYLVDAEKNKCYLTFLRLKYHNCLTEDVKEKLRAYIYSKRFGTDANYAWLLLKENENTNSDYFTSYLDIVKPSNEELKSMLDDLGHTNVLARSFLINEGGKNKVGFSDLEL